MRVTYNYMTMKYLSGIQQNLSTLTQSNEKVGAGRSLLNPEDDPVNYASALNVQRLIDDSAQYTRNAENALTWLTNEDNELQRAVDIVSKAKNEIAIYGINDSQNATSRKALAGEVSNLLAELVDISNAQYNGQYIFGGFETDTIPFEEADREVSGVVANIAESNVIVRKKYGDLTELSEGLYHITATINNGMVSVSMTDSRFNTVVLDTNGTDETNGNGNMTSDTLTIKYEQGMVINTGLGVGISLPDKNLDGQVLKLDFNYKPGNDLQYLGDDGELQTNIGSNQKVTLNVTGEDVFMETFKTLKGTVTNTVNGLPATETSMFSKLDGSNISFGDSITIDGTDHNGYKVGIAKVLAPQSVELDMTEASDDERTLTLQYGGETYSLILEQDSYENTEEVAFALNRLVDNIPYLGDEIEVGHDGDRLLFTTTKSGSDVSLSITGSPYNKLGFTSLPQTGTGSNTTFNLYYDGFNQTVQNTHSGITIAASASPGTAHTYYINDTAVTFNAVTGDTAADLQTKLNDALAAAGFDSTVDASISDLGGGTYDVVFSMFNYNADNTTYLSTKTDNGTVADYQFSTPRDADYPQGAEKSISDFLEFVENLYDNSIDASMENGQLVIEDLRSGTSRLTFNMDESNTGIGHPNLDPRVIVSGNYTGSYDDTWDIDVNIAGGNIQIDVTDKNGNLIFDNTTAPLSQANYRGQEIQIAEGVSITLGQIAVSTSIRLDLTADTNLSFGDMNVTEQGSNVNVFRSLQNLYDALNLDIPDSGIGEPSAWADETLNSTAVPYFDGEFTGNYNDLLTYEIQTYNNSSEFFIQSELTYKTNDVIAYPTDNDIDFDININSGGTLYTKNITVAAGSYADETELLNNIIDLVNTDSTFQGLGVHAKASGGKLVLESGSGMNELSVNYNNQDTIFTFGLERSGTTGVTTPPLTYAADATLDVNYYDGSNWQTATVTVPAGTYADRDAVLAEVTNDLGGTNISAAYSADGYLVFNPSAPTTDVVVSGDTDATLGFYEIQSTNSIESTLEPSLNLEDTTIAQRTLSFSYTSGGTDFTESIVIDDKKYANLDELLANIDSKLTAAGLTDINVTSHNGNRLAFEFSAPTTNLHVSGDYEGVTGFYKAGEEAKIKVTGQDGELIAEYKVNTANQKYAVADGVYNYFDSGYLYSTDTFTGAVGSGIEHEIPVLDLAETQVLKSLTLVGTRQNRVDSAITFHETLTYTNENIKAGYVGSTTIDQAKNIAEYQMAQQAYEAALSTTAKIMQLSLLNFI